MGRAASTCTLRRHSSVVGEAQNQQRPRAWHTGAVQVGSLCFHHGHSLHPGISVPGSIAMLTFQDHFWRGGRRHRRQFLQVGALALGGLNLADTFGVRAAAAGGNGINPTTGSAGAGQELHSFPTRRSSDHRKSVV